MIVSSAPQTTPVSLPTAFPVIAANTPTAKAIQIFHQHYLQHQMLIFNRFKQDNDTISALRAHAEWMDQLIQTLYRYFHPTIPADIAIIAVGGYGRNELFPFSDIDLLILTKEKGKKAKTAHQLTEAILYALWDMKWQVGQMVASTQEAITSAKEDLTACTSQLTSRFLCGEQNLYDHWQKLYWSEVVQESATTRFVEAKLTEREARHSKTGDSRYVLEPRIKDGKGGLRDIHTLYWLARYAYQIQKPQELVKQGVFTTTECRSYQKAHLFMSTVRLHLHLLTGRAEEQLTFDMQRAIAALMDYRDDGGAQAIERFMKAYFLYARQIGKLTHIFCAALEGAQKRSISTPFRAIFFNPTKLQGFTIRNSRLMTPYPDFFREDPVRLLTIFSISQREKIRIHPEAIREISRTLSLITPALRIAPEANKLFLDILCHPNQPEAVLRRMSEAGILGKFIPDFGRVIGQMQFDMYHVYTVDEHTLFAIGILNQIATGILKQEFPLASRAIQQIDSFQTLALSVFCHDIAKGRGGDHSVLGEKVVRKLAERMGFDINEQQNAAWLVREHLLMSRTAFKRDLTDPQTIEQFVSKVQSPEKLRMLFLLTIVDIRAVGPKVWNSWKATLLHDLYHRASTRMGIVGDTDGLRHSDTSLIGTFNEKLPHWSSEERASYLALGNEAFFAAFDTETHIHLAHLVHDANGQFRLQSRLDETQDITEIAITAPDRKGLFATLAAALSKIGANILNAKVFTLKNGIAVDVFYIQDAQGHAFNKPNRLKELQILLDNVLEKGKALDFSPPPLKKDSFILPPQVIIENDVSTQHTVIEVKGRDRTGFLYLATHALSELDLSITTAHVSSYGEKAVDVFYVKDRFGMKILNEAKLKQIQEKLLDALQEYGKS